MVDQWFFGWHFSLHSTLHTWDIHISAFRQNRTEIMKQNTCVLRMLLAGFCCEKSIKSITKHASKHAKWILQSQQNRIKSSTNSGPVQMVVFFLITWIPEFMGNVAGTPYISYIYISWYEKKTSFHVDVPINQPNDWIAVRTHLGTWTLKKRSAHFLPGSLGLLVPPFGKNIAHSYDWIRGSRHIPILVHSHMTWWCLNMCKKYVYIYIYT